MLLLCQVGMSLRATMCLKIPSPMILVDRQTTGTDGRWYAGPRPPDGREKADRSRFAERFGLAEMHRAHVLSHSFVRLIFEILSHARAHVPEVDENPYQPSSCP